MTTEISNMGLFLWTVVSAILATHYVWVLFSNNSYKAQAEKWTNRYWELREAQEALMMYNQKLLRDLRMAQRHATRANADRTPSKKGSSTSAKEFSGEELRTLISLCHPDRHGGKESAVRITQKLLALRSGRT